MVYKIGFICENFGSGDDSHKFVVVQEDEDQVLYTAKRGRLNEFDYKDLFSEFGIESVIASGLIDHGGSGKKYLGIWSGPLINKYATFDLMINFEKELLISYKKINPEIETVINLCRKF